MQMIKPHSSFVDADAVRLHYLEWDPQIIRKTQPLSIAEQIIDPDNDDVPLVLLHGLGATADTWQLVAQHLYQSHPIVALDLRGHGQSDQPATDYDLVT